MCNSVTLASGQKFSISPLTAGLGTAGLGYDGSGNEVGAGAVIDGPAGSQLTALTRVSTYDPATGLAPAEDYVGQQ